MFNTVTLTHSVANERMYLTECVYREESNNFRWSVAKLGAVTWTLGKAEKQHLNCGAGDTD